MHNRYKHLPRIFIVLAIAEAVMLLNLCSRKPDTQIIESHTSDTIPGDSITYEVHILKPVPKYIDTGSRHYFDVDSLAILKAYFAKVIYLDTLLDDSSAFIAILDTIYNNRLQNRKLYFANRRATVINNTTYAQPQNEKMQLYVGAMLATMPDKINIGPVILITTPRGMAYSYEYGINSRSHTLTFACRLRLYPRKVPPD